MKTAARAAAPGRLGLIELFLNSLDREAGRDDLGTLEGAREWLAANRLAPAQAELSEADRCGNRSKGRAYRNRRGSAGAEPADTVASRAAAS